MQYLVLIIFMKCRLKYAEVWGYIYFSPSLNHFKYTITLA